MTIKKGDTVRVIAGKDRGKQGTVQSVIPLSGRVVVEGINIRKRHFKPTRTRTQGGIVEFPGALQRANVMVLCPHCSKPTRIKHMIGSDDKKYRSCMHCQGNLDTK